MVNRRVIVGNVSSLWAAGSYILKLSVRRPIIVVVILCDLGQESFDVRKGNRTYQADQLLDFSVTLVPIKITQS